MDEEEDLCNFVAEIQVAMMEGLEPEGVVLQLEEQGFSKGDGDKLVSLALCVARVALAQIEGRDDPESIRELDSSGLHDDLCEQLVSEALARLTPSDDLKPEERLDQFALNAQIDPISSRRMFRLSQAVVADANKGKVREAIIVRLEASNYMVGEESEFVDHTLWAYETAKEIAEAGQEISDELLAGDPPWAVYTLLAFWQILREQSPEFPDFSTPELALKSLEAAYRTGDMETIIACKDFHLESMFVLPGMRDVPDDVRMATVSVLESRFRDDMRENSPEWNGVVSTVIGREDVTEDMVILTEQLDLPDGERVEMRHFVGKRDDSWKVVAPYSEKMHDAWMRNFE